jgi:prepilin-type N-terminal cleavage/methylation domain-containing protein
MNNEKGFTLVELLVVITVISLLVALGGASYMNSMRSGRDAVRRGDLNALQQAFEQYFGENNSQYNDDCEAMAAPYLRGDYPQDPIGNPAEYTNDPNYESTCTVNGYCICAMLEQDDLGNSTTSDCSSWGTGDWFCIENQQ